MKNLIRFSKLFLPAAIFSSLLTVGGVVSYFVMGGFNLGVDFQAGMIQEVQFAPTAFGITFSGTGNAIISFDRNNLYIVNSGVGVESRTNTFPFSEYGTVGALCRELESRVEGINVRLEVPDGINSQWLLRSTQGSPQLGDVPYIVHYLDPASPEIRIETVREALDGLGQTVSVQSLGQPSDRHFMIRLEDRETMPAAVKTEIEAELEAVVEAEIEAELEAVIETEIEAELEAVTEAELEAVAETEIEAEIEALVEAGTEDGISPGAAAAEKKIVSALEDRFGEGEVVILRSDYVGSRFSKDLTDQAGLLMGLTLLIILVYVTIRFKPQYAVGSVVGIMHDALVIVAFVVWSGMEFNTSTIAAILTILGYSINNTIVVFDRVRENRRIYPDETLVNVLDLSLTATLSRTVITTLTTMLAVISLYIFTTGSMKDFALALLVGMVSGVYTTTFIASGVVYLWENQRIKREKKKLAVKMGQAVKGAISKA